MSRSGDVPRSHNGNPRQRSDGGGEPPRLSNDGPVSAHGRQSGSDNPPLVHRDYSNSLDRTLTRAASINLKRDVSAGPFSQHGTPVDSPSNGRLAGLFSPGPNNSSRAEPRDPAIDAALTLTDCFLRRESSLEKLGLLKRENSLGGAAKRGNSSVEWKGLDMTMPPPHSEVHAVAPADLPPPPRAERQSSLHSLASIAELTSNEKGARSIFGDEVRDAPAEPLERNLSLVFQHQDSARDLIGAGVASPCVDSSDDEDSGDENPKPKPGDYKQVNSYEFFAQNTPQQVYGGARPQEEEAAADMFAPSFNDLAAVCLNQDTRRQPSAARVPASNPAWMAPAAAAAAGTASPMNLVQHATDTTAVKYVGKLTVEQRREHVQRYLEKKKRRIWGRKVEYQCRKNLASKRARVHGRFA